MKFLVGTMYCGENEYDECIESLKNQTHQAWDQFVVKDLPNKLAHETLYETFMSRASECDLFLKLDADMVLEDPQMFARIVAYFEQHPQLDGITIRVHDFFSDTLIHGLHVYRSDVRWPRTEEKLFVDKPPVSPDRFRIGVKELEPVASHCKNPSPFFAFHYGLHRGLKARQSTGGSHAYYLQTIEQVWKHFRRTRDQRLGLAVMGGELALSGEVDVEDLDLNRVEWRELCQRYEDLSPEDFSSAVQSIRSTPKSKVLVRRLIIGRYRITQGITAAIRGIWPTLVSLIPKRIRRVLRGS